MARIARIARTISMVSAVALLAIPTFGSTGVAEANGTVVDEQGNPLEGVEVKLQSKGNEAGSFSGTTNKKGKYFIGGVYTPLENDRWTATASKDGWVPIEIRVESRTSGRVLTAEPFTKALTPMIAGPEFVIRPLGRAQLDFKMVTAAAFAERQPAAAAATNDSATKPAAKSTPWEEALAKASAGDLEGALPLLSKAVEEAPDDPVRRETQAKVLYQLGHHEEAESVARTAIESTPARLEPRMILYGTQVARKQLQLARQTLEAARKIAPDDPKLLTQLAWVTQELGDRSAATEAYQKLTAVAPRNAEAWMALGDLYAASGDSKRSAEAYENVVEIDPASAFQTYFNIGALVMNRRDRSPGDVEKAIGAFRRAIGIKPDYAQAHQQLGLALIETGDRGAARSALGEYVRLRPNAKDAAEMQELIKALN